MESSDSTVGVIWQQSRKGEIYKVERGGMITRSLVGCLFRLEHPKGGWQTRLVIYFQVIASDIYTTRLISTTYIYTHSIIMIRPNLCMGRRSSS